ncbi:MAG TPA: IS1595 family transposase [Methylocystis sp.]|nr:IS1595 family transposase [Methylocystis sp.]
MASVLNEPYFQDEAAAFARLEAIVWPEGPVCPHCGNKDRIGVLKNQRTKPSKKNPEGIERHGLKKCYACRKQFTVRIGAVFEDSPVPLHVWFQAAYLMCSSKKGVSSNQLHRTLGVSLQTAWFMSHRLREAMRSGALAFPFGSDGGAVEIDETFIGRKKDMPKRRGFAHKHAVLSLVDRNTKQVRSFHVGGTSAKDLMPIIKENVAKEAAIMTDEAGQYERIGDHFASHERVNHSQEAYVRGDARTNTAEGYYSIFKRGMKGVYQHCSEKHLHRYVAEFDFRYNNRVRLGCDDLERTNRGLGGVVGRRLTYRDSAWA